MGKEVSNRVLGSGFGSSQARDRLLHINVQLFRGGLVFKAHRLLYHSTLGLRVIKKKTKDGVGALSLMDPGVTQGRVARIAFVY